MPCVESEPGCMRKREGRNTSMAMQTMPFIQRSFLYFTPFPNLLSLSLPRHFTPHMVLTYTRSQGEGGKGGWMIIQLHHTLPPAWPTHTHTHTHTLAQAARTCSVSCKKENYARCCHHTHVNYSHCIFKATHTHIHTTSNRYM